MSFTLSKKRYVCQILDICLWCKCVMPYRSLIFLDEDAKKDVSFSLTSSSSSIINFFGKVDSTLFILVQTCSGLFWLLHSQLTGLDKTRN
jgi:hypothetical protein